MTVSTVQMLRRLLAWDESMLVAVSRWHRPLMTRAMRGVTHLGDGQSLTFLGLVLLLAGTPQTRQLGWMLAMSTGLATLFAQAIKRFTKRRRPNVGIQGFTALVHNPDAFSFPSGHTAAAVALAVAWAGEGSGLGLLASAFALLVGFSRVYLGVHYPLDVMAGATLGLAAGAIARIVG
jgi:undecaprenyl-diphosphatase